MTTRSRVTRLASASLALAALVGLPLGSASSASADAVPYTDPNSNGTLTLCDHYGKPVTSGRIDAQPFVWLVASTSAAPKGFDVKNGKSVLMAYQPRKAHDPGEWSGEQLGGSSTYTNTRTPMAALTEGDSPLQWFTQNFPPSWNGFVQLRMYFGAPNQSQYTLGYPTADLRITGDTWTLIRGGGASCTAGSATSVERTQLSQDQLQRHVIEKPATAQPSPTKGESEVLGGTAPAGAIPGATSSAGATPTTAAAGVLPADGSSGGSSGRMVLGLVLLVAAAIGGGAWWWRRGATR